MTTHWQRTSQKDIHTVGSFQLKEQPRDSSGAGLRASKLRLSSAIPGADSLPKDRVQLLGDVVLLVLDVRLAQLDGDVGISFPVDVSWVEVCGLEGTEGMGQCCPGQPRIQGWARSPSLRTLGHFSP